MANGLSSPVRTAVLVLEPMGYCHKRGPVGVMPGTGLTGSPGLNMLEFRPLLYASGGRVLMSYPLRPPMRVALLPELGRLFCLAVFLLIFIRYDVSVESGPALKFGAVLLWTLCEKLTHHDVEGVNPVVMHLCIWKCF